MKKALHTAPFGGIYRADCYCETCIERIEATLTSEHAVRPPDPVDSDEWPLSAPAGATDCPNCCGSGEECPERCPESRHAPILEEPLTEMGIEYVVEKLRDYLRDRTGLAEVLAGWWRHWRSDLRKEFSEDERDVLDCLPNLRWRRTDLGERFLPTVSLEGVPVLAEGRDAILPNSESVRIILRDACVGTGLDPERCSDISLCRRSVRVFAVWEPYDAAEAAAKGA